MEKLWSKTKPDPSLHAALFESDIKINNLDSQSNAQPQFWSICHALERRKKWILAWMHIYEVSFDVTLHDGHYGISFHSSAQGGSAICSPGEAEELKRCQRTPCGFNFTLHQLSRSALECVHNKNNAETIIHSYAINSVIDNEALHFI